MKLDKENVLELINLFGSARNFIGNQFSYLNDNGFNMHLICSPANDLSEFAKQQNIEYQAVNLNRQFTPWQDFKALIKICKYIRKNQIGTIIGHQTKGRLLGVLAGRIMGVPNIIIFAHGSIFETSTGLKRKILIFENKFESICAHKIVCVSHFVANLRLDNKIDKPEKQFILGKGTCGGIDTQKKFNPEFITEDEQEELRQKLDIKKEDFIIGFSGRIVRDKGIVELVEAFKLLQNRHPDKSIKLMFVGVFENRDAIPAQTTEYINTDPNVIFTGYVKNRIESYYSIMSVLILPSYRDGFGMSVIEASALKVPVIASNVTGCYETLENGYTGFHVNISPEDICEKIERLFNPILSKKLGENGRTWVVENFDHLKVWPYILEVINE